ATELLAYSGSAPLKSSYGSRLVPRPADQARGHGDVFHDEIRAAIGGRPGVEYVRDVGMIHQGESLTFGLEASHNVTRVQARLDHLEGDVPADRMLLARQVDDAHTAFAEHADRGIHAEALTRFGGRLHRRGP